MNDLVDSRTRNWAIVAALLGLLAMLGMEWLDEPDATPLVLSCVGVGLPVGVSRRQRGEHLQSKEIAAVRGGSERTVREHARSVYAKAGLTGRAALSAFFLEDLLAPIDTRA